jgi:hypothetical protein
MEKPNRVNAGALWGDEDERFNLELENFGVDLDAVNETPICTKRMFRCWIEKSEKPLLKENKALAKIWLLGRYGGLLFPDGEEPFETCYISKDKMHWKPFR